MSGSFDVVTGAFGYSGQFLARRLLAEGRRVRTLTNSPHRPSSLAGRVEVHPLAFEDPSALEASLRGARVLFNTYWVRFNHGSFRHAEAVKNTVALFEAAKRAGVGRVVHVSITNPSEDSHLEYFRGKAYLERELEGSGLSHAIVRPAVLFGGGDILVNNVAWMLRHLPIFGVFGDGRYRLQPIHVEDFAEVLAAAGAGREDVTFDAVGPETFTYRELATTLGQILGCPRPIVSVPPLVGLAAAAVLGRVLGDVVVTRPEIEGLMADLLYTGAPPSGTTRLTDWARAHADGLGRRYASELLRRRDRTAPSAEIEGTTAPRPSRRSSIPVL